VPPYAIPRLLAYAKHSAAVVNRTYPSPHRLIPASISRYRSNVGDGATDIDGAMEIEGSDDGVDDHDEVKGSQMGL